MGKILIIDDDQNYSVMLTRQLKKHGHDVSHEPTLAQGLAAVESVEPELVFLDVNLPDGNGLGVLKNIRESACNPEVIIITGRGEQTGAALSVNSGAWDYICKGDSYQQIMLALNGALEFHKQKKTVSPKVLDLCGIVGQSAPMKACFEKISQASGNDTNVLICGETGTGKELCALAIHQNSRRSQKNFVIVDCAALPENLVESMLFGHRKGAFTGAHDNRVGLMEQANEGTLFLDEVGEMPLSLQKAFLRALQERRFRPVGGDREVTSNFRLIAATNKNLSQMVADGTFREDLLYRLRSLTIEMPPLRERGDDVFLIAKATAAKIFQRDFSCRKPISPEFFETLSHYNWPGNVRELVNAMEFAISGASCQNVLYPIHLPPEIRLCAIKYGIQTTRSDATPSLDETAPLGEGLPPFQQYRAQSTKKYLLALMSVSGGNIAEACRISELSRAHLYTLLKEHDISKN